MKSKGGWHCLPNCDDKGNRPVSNKQIKRWIESGAVRAYGSQQRNPQMEIEIPVWGLSYFKGERLITIS